MNDLIPEHLTGRDEKNLAMLVHLLPLTGFIIPGMNIVIPLVIWCMKRDQSSFMDHHARESLNFQITLTLVFAVWVALKFILIGLLLLPLVPVVVIVISVLMIRAARRASRGQYYRYPCTLRLVC